MKRYVYYPTMTLVLPCTMSAMLIVLTFILPAQSGEKVGLSKSVTTSNKNFGIRNTRRFLQIAEKLINLNIRGTNVPLLHFEKTSKNYLTSISSAYESLFKKRGLKSLR